MVCRLYLERASFGGRFLFLFFAKPMPPAAEVWSPNHRPPEFHPLKKMFVCFKRKCVMLALFCPVKILQLLCFNTSESVWETLQR